MNNVEKEEGVNNSVIIPIILIFEIMLLLPVRVLLRFRCVCKEWCELIDSRLFKDTFLAVRQRAMPVDDQLFIYKGAEITSNCWYSEYQSIISPSTLSLEAWFGDYQSILALASAAVIPPSSSSSCSATNSISNSNGDFEIPVQWSVGPVVEIINHVDGIICLFDHGDYNQPSVSLKEVESFHWLAITLLNPALRQFRKLPLPPQEFDLLGDIYNRRVQGIGIGFSNNNNEYKVVALVTVFEKQRDDYASPYKHIGLVYRLTTNSWTILSEFDVSCKCFCYPHSVFSNGSLHWCIKSSDDQLIESAGTNKHHILAFDVTSESFRKFPFPHGNNNRYPQTNPGPQLFMVNKSTIALVESIHLNVFDPAIEIWVMNEYGNNDSWTKRWLITNLPNFAATLCFLDQDKILIELLTVGLISYDLSKGQLGDEMPTRRSVFSYSPLVSCHESFVSVKQL